MAMIKCKECGAPVSTKADKCPRCGAPVKSKGSGCLTVVVAIFGLSLIGSMLNSSNPSSTLTMNATERAERDRIRAEEKKKSQARQDKMMACVMGQSYIKKMLKAPRTAKFDHCDPSNTRSLPDNQFEIHGYVDAQNGFGAMIRNQYRVVVKHYPDESSWSFIDGEVE